MRLFPLLLSGLLSAGSLLGVEPARPNIILIMADDLGYGDISSFGSESILTPHIDSIATRGAKLTDFHSNGAVCSPTRAALFTGRYQQRSGVTGVVTAKNHRDKGLPLVELTFAEVLRKAGYATALFGKWHLGYEAAFNPTKQGFDEFKGFVSGNIDYHRHIDQEGFFDWWQGSSKKDEAGYLTDLITDHALDFISRKKDQPFCLVLTHGAPHYPLQGRKTPGFRTEGKTKVNVPVDNPAAVYKEMVEVMDQGVGRILDQLEKLDLTNTLVIFCSDNGPASHGSAGPYRGKKGQPWEGGHRVPGCVMWPRKIPAGQVIDETILTMDLFPTFIALADIDDAGGPTLDGINLLPTLCDKQPIPARTLFWSLGQGWAVRRSNWKVVGSKQGSELFDLEEDPAESTDLSEEFAPRKKELIKQFQHWKKASKAEVPVS